MAYSHNFYDIIELISQCMRVCHSASSKLHNIKNQITLTYLPLNSCVQSNFGILISYIYFNLV